MCSGTFSGEMSWRTRSPLRPSATSANIDAFTDPYLHRAHIVELSPGGEHLVEVRLLRAFHVDDRQAVPTIGDVGVGAGDVETVGVGQGHSRAGDRHGMIGVGEAEDLEALVVGDEGILELDRHGARVLEEGTTVVGFSFPMCNVSHAHHGQALRTRDVDSAAADS